MSQNPMFFGKETANLSTQTTGRIHKERQWISWKHSGCEESYRWHEKNL